MMDQNSPAFQVFLMLFFGVFQVIGAVFVGLGVRQMLRGESAGTGQIFFGAIFAGAGTLFSGVFMHELNAWGFPVGVMTTCLVALGVIFSPEEILQRFGASVGVIALGGFATLVGGAVLIGTLRAQEEILFGILFGGCWGSVGLGFLLTGVNALVRGKPLRFKEKGPGKYEVVVDEDEFSKDPKRKKKR